MKPAARHPIFGNPCPAIGRVVGLSVLTIGGVVRPGMLILDIVPGNAILVIEAGIKTVDVDKLFVGQATRVWLSTLEQGDVREALGRIPEISADLLEGKRTGQLPCPKLSRMGSYEALSNDEGAVSQWRALGKRWNRKGAHSKRGRCVGRYEAHANAAGREASSANPGPSHIIRTRQRNTIHHASSSRHP